MATTGWLGEQTVFTIQSGTYSTWIASNVYISSNTRSGNNVTVSGTIKLYIRCNWQTSGLVAYYGDPITVTPRGGSAIEIKGWTSTTSLDFYKDQEIGSVDFTTTYSEPASTTSSTFSVYYKDTRRDDWVNTTLSWTASVDPGYVAPSTPTVSLGSLTKSSIVITYGTSSYGTPSSGTTYLYGGASPSPTSQITSKNTTGSSSYTQSGLASNTRYYYRARANNGQLNSNYSTEKNAVTLASSPSVSVGSVSGNSATINYSTAADGGEYSKTIQYSTDGGATWKKGALVTGGSAQTGSFTIDNLPSGENTVLVRTNTDSGADTPITINVEIQTKVKFYGPVRRYKVVSGYTSSVNENMFSGFTAEGFMQSYEEKFGAMYGVPDHITVNHEAEDGSTTTGKCIWIYFDNGTRKFCTEVTASIVMDLNIWGMNFPGSEGSLTPNADTVTLNSIYYDGYKSKEVKKLYGSVKNYEGADGLTHERVMTDQPESIVDVNQTAFLNFLKNSNLFKKDVEKYGEPQQLLCYVATLGSTHNVYVAGGYGQGVTSAWYFHASNPDWTVVASQLLSATGITLETSANLSASRINLINPRYSSVSKKIIKLYGSANGQSELVFSDES